MCKKGCLFVAFLILQVTVSQAQKVKFKDLIELLNAKQYEMAEPFLKRYLKENDDNPSGYLYMGIIYQEKSVQKDLLKQTDALIVNIDSAIFYFDKAYPLITEKEIKRNDENYQMYTRRDMRTGEFRVTQSDVQLDIETRVKSLKDKRDKVKSLKAYFIQADKAYANANRFFKAIEARYDSEKEFYLRSDDQLLVELNNLASVFDSSQVAFKGYKQLLSTIGKTSYNQELSLLEIKDFKKGGSAPADFFSNNVKLWDYTHWAKQVSEIIKKEIYPLRDNLVSYDIEINKLDKKLRTDSVSVKNDLTKLVDKLLHNQLARFDADPLPTDVFKMKIAELEYYSDLIIHKPMRDSVNVTLRTGNLEKEVAAVRKLDSIAAKLVNRNFEKDGQDYQHFIAKAYGTEAVLKSMIKATKDFASRELRQKENQLATSRQSLMWIVAKPDSIPLFLEESDKRSVKPLTIVTDSYTVGLKYLDSLATGYFYTITPSRIPDLGFTFPVDAASFKRRNLPIIKSLSLNDANQLYFVLIYSENKGPSGFPVTLAKISRSGGVLWSHNYKFEFKPVELLYSANSNELMIKTTGSTGESKIVAVDQTGKKLQ